MAAPDNQSMIAGLFTTPQEYQQQQQAQNLALGAEMARLTPSQQGLANIYAGGRGLGQAVGGALGAPDEQLQMITQQQQLLKGLDLNDPQALVMGARQATQMGNINLANSLLQKADQAQQRALTQVNLGETYQSKQRMQQAQTLLPQLVMQDGKIDQNVLRSLASTPEGQAALNSYTTTQKNLRQSGLTAGAQALPNPFDAFVQDPNIPPAIQKYASQLKTSLDQGLIEPEKINDYTKGIVDMVSRAENLSQNRDIQKANTQFNQMMAQSNFDLKQALEANKPKQFSYIQKKEIDEITLAEQGAQKANANADAAQRALPLIDQAYSGRIEATTKGLLGAAGISTEAKVANDRLATLSQSLALNSPKFSGPTSDKDTARYDKAVGDLANPNASPQSKKEALKDIISLSALAQKQASDMRNYFEEKNTLRGFIMPRNAPEAAPETGSNMPMPQGPAPSALPSGVTVKRKGG